MNRVRGWIFSVLFVVGFWILAYQALKGDTVNLTALGSAIGVLGVMGFAAYGPNG